MIDNPQMGFPEGPMPEDQPSEHTQHPDITMPPMQVYETLTEQIPAAPLDLSTVALDVASEVDWMRDPVTYSQQYTDRIVQATQAQYGNLVPEHTEAEGPIDDQQI